jgi:hypothetical protein
MQRHVLEVALESGSLMAQGFDAVITELVRK